MTRIPSNHPCLPESVRSQLGKSKRHKYGAKATIVDGRKFASKKEAKRYGELKLLRDQGRIEHLVLQPRFALYAAGGGEVGYYVADFMYDDVKTGVTVVEDVKSKATATPLYKWKKRHAELQGIKITEVY